MERRDFLRTLSGAGLPSMLDPAYLGAKDRLQSRKSPADPVPKRRYGRAEDTISVIGFDEIDKVSLGLRFTFHLPANAMVPPGDWELFEMAVELAQSGALTPLNENEKEIARAIAMESDPISRKQV